VCVSCNNKRIAKKFIAGWKSIKKFYQSAAVLLGFCFIVPQKSKMLQKVAVAFMN